jgi:hypothetical protein
MISGSASSLGDLTCIKWMVQAVELCRELRECVQSCLEPTRPPAVVLVDPHSDLAQQALALVPAGRQSDVVYRDVGYALRRPFGLNLLDVGLGWSRDQLVENALRVLWRLRFVLLRWSFERVSSLDDGSTRMSALTITRASTRMCSAAWIVLMVVEHRKCL